MILYDNFVSENWFLIDLMNSKYKKKIGWYDGWWNKPPENIWEKLIHKIWKDWPQVESSKGFEWWINISEKNSLGWHQDKDEKIGQENGAIICPNFGSIYYPFPHVVEGGFLEIKLNDDDDMIEKLAPIYNRLIMFDPSQQHRVSKVYEGKRISFVVNLWKEHKPFLRTHE
jgi:hypothetical protein